MNLTLTANGEVFTIALEDSTTSRDLLSLLPLTLELTDYAQTEKITYLPRKLSTTGAAAGYTPKAGDLAYYAPWGNLALFYRDFSYSTGLIRLGRLVDGLDRLQPLDKADITLTIAKE